MKLIFQLGFVIMMLVALVTFPSAGSTSDFETANQLIVDVQKKLDSLGYNPGPIDGILGNNTKKAITNFQRDYGLQTTGTLDEDTKKRIKSVTTESDEEAEKVSKFGATQRAQKMGEKQGQKVENQFVGDSIISAADKTFEMKEYKKAAEIYAKAVKLSKITLDEQAHCFKFLGRSLNLAKGGVAIHGAPMHYYFTWRYLQMKPTDKNESSLFIGKFNNWAKLSGMYQGMNTKFTSLSQMNDNVAKATADLFLDSGFAAWLALDMTINHDHYNKPAPEPQVYQKILLLYDGQIKSTGHTGGPEDLKLAVLYFDRIVIHQKMGELSKARADAEMFIKLMPEAKDGPLMLKKLKK